MNDIKSELAKSWLIKAKRDLLSASQLAQADEPLLDTAAYHCQQAAEREAGHILTPLAVEFRYPGEYIEPEQEEYKDAFVAATQIYDFIIKHFPEDLFLQK